MQRADDIHKKNSLNREKMRLASNEEDKDDEPSVDSERIHFRDPMTIRL